MSVFTVRGALAPVLCCAVGAVATAAGSGGSPHGAARPNEPGVNEPSAAAALVVLAGNVRTAGGTPLAGAGVVARHGGAVLGTAITDGVGAYRLAADGLRMGDSVTLSVRHPGYAARAVRVVIAGATARTDVVLTPTTLQLEQTAVAATTTDSVRVTPVVPAPSVGVLRSDRRVRRTGAQTAAVPTGIAPPTFAPMAAPASKMASMPHPRARTGASTGWNREQYDRIDENPFVAVAVAPRSTFSLDVDRASYANVRRFLHEGARPPADAVRLEELVNYFPYHNPDPADGEALAVTTEVGPAPWRPNHELVRVALQARRSDPATLPPSNLVFLVDVSGSMFEPDKLPLVKQALGVLVARLRPVDRVALVAYAGNAGLVLPSTSGEHKARILAAIDALEAGGSTAGGEGLELAYQVARENARPGANSRVILATDGDFNVGTSSDAELERLIEAKRAQGTYLTVLGFGEGNLQDAKMKKLAKRGNGNYAYVDDLPEAEKVFGQELGGTLVTVANDAKLQVEFNPAAVRSYRLLGYEGRLLRDEDFADDRKDAGDVGAGHAVTALYEIVPSGAPPDDSARGVTPLRYGARAGASFPAPEIGGAELLYVQLRYKRPGESTSRLVSQVTYAPRNARGGGAPSADFRFASAVAEFGMLLRRSEYRGHASAAQVIGIAREAIGDDPGGHRAEFVGLVQAWQALGRGDVVGVRY